MPPPTGSSGNAIASLVLGICGLVFVPLIPSIVAIVLGRSARREIEQRPGLGGAGMATAGIVLGWIGVGVVVVGALLLVLLLAVASSSP